MHSNAANRLDRLPRDGIDDLARLRGGTGEIHLRP